MVCSKPNQLPVPNFKQNQLLPKTAEENTYRGLAAVDKAVAQALQGNPGKAVVKDAMHRNDVGSISFYWGNPKSNGLSHIIAKHGVEVMDEVVETIAKGKLGKAVPIPRRNSERMPITHNGRLVILQSHHDGSRNTWVVTGYREPKMEGNEFNMNALKGAIYFRSK